MKISAVKKSLISLLLLITSGTSIYALLPQSRADPMCDYMPNEAKIYCYGGHRFGVNGTVTTEFDQYFVSMNLTQNWRITDMPNAWNPITQDVGPNVHFGMVAVPNENLIFMHGGAVSPTMQTRYKAAYFKTTDVDSGWKQVIPEQTGSRVTTQSAILGPDNSTIYIWGGMRNNDTGNMEPGDEQYPRMMYTLDVKNWQWGTKSMAAAGYTYAQPVLVGSSIYYIGGYTTASNIIRANPMDSVLTYNTDSDTWQTLAIGGPVIPSTRMRHTATLKPITGEIILFGGANPENDGQSRDDYFYILSTQGGKLEWSTRPLIGDFEGLGIIGHSAILTGDYLFILFGAVNVNNNTETFTLSQKIRAMDVNSYSWVSFVRGSTSETQSPTTDVDQNDETLNDSSVSAGTIAGAVVGGVAGLAIIAGITAFFLIRRRKSQKLEEEKNEFSSDRMLPDETDVSQEDSTTVYVTSKGQSDSSVIEGEPPIFYNPEKPDGSVPNLGDRNNPRSSLAKKPVKPDGGL